MKRQWPTTNSTSTLIMLMVFANNLTSKKSASWGQSPRQPEYNCCWGNIHWKTGKHSILENNQLYLYLFSYLFIYLFVYWKTVLTWRSSTRRMWSIFSQWSNTLIPELQMPTTFTQLGNPKSNRDTWRQVFIVYNIKDYLGIMAGAGHYNLGPIYPWLQPQTFQIWTFLTLCMC